MAKELKRLLFNKKTGVLIGDIPTRQSLDGLNLDKFSIKEVEIDPIAEVYDGDYATGTIKSVDMATRFSEKAVNNETTSEITAKYDLHEQLNQIRNAVKAIGGESLPAEFTAMCTHIEDAIAKGKTKKATYAGNDAYEYLSNDDIATKAKNATDFS